MSFFLNLTIGVLLFFVYYLLFGLAPRRDRRFKLGNKLYQACLDGDVNTVREVLNTGEDIDPNYIVFAFDAIASKRNHNKKEILELMIEKDSITREVRSEYILCKILDMREYNLAKKLLLSSGIRLQETIIQKIIATGDEELYSIALKRKENI